MRFSENTPLKQEQGCLFEEGHLILLQIHETIPNLWIYGGY